MTQLMLFDAPTAGHIPSTAAAVAIAPTATAAAPLRTGASQSAQNDPQRVGNLAHLVLARYDMMARRREARRQSAAAHARRAESA